jgi:hypothetical protein
MMPITKFLSCTDPLDQFESLSYHQTQHAKTYVTGLVAGRNKTVTGIAREVLPATLLYNTAEPRDDERFSS